MNDKERILQIVMRIRNSSIKLGALSDGLYPLRFGKAYAENWNAWTDLLVLLREVFGDGAD